MARKPVIEVAPVLPPQSIDFNAMHDAIAKGATAEEAVAAGTGEPVPAPEPEAPAEAAE